MTMHTPGRFSAVLLLASGVFATAAQAIVIENDATLTSITSSDQRLRLSQSFASQRLGLFEFKVTPAGGNDFTFAAQGIAEKYALFNAKNGDVMDSSFLASNTPVVSNYIVPTNAKLHFALFETKVFSYWDQGIAGQQDLFGWLSMTYTLSGLVINKGASALGSGIVVGTLTAAPVPELNTSAMFMVGGMGLLWAASRRKLAQRS